MSAIVGLSAAFARLEMSPAPAIAAMAPMSFIAVRRSTISSPNFRFATDGLSALFRPSFAAQPTFVNRGRRLLPGDRQPLRDGDEVIVGKTFLKFHVLDK